MIITLIILPEAEFLLVFFFFPILPASAFFVPYVRVSLLSAPGSPGAEYVPDPSCAGFPGAASFARGACLYPEGSRSVPGARLSLSGEAEGPGAPVCFGGTGFWPPYFFLYSL